MVNWNVCYKIWDIAEIKVSVAAFTLFLITYQTELMDWVSTIDPMVFLVVAVIFGARPGYKFLFKR